MINPIRYRPQRRDERLVLHPFSQWLLALLLGCVLPYFIGRCFNSLPLYTALGSGFALTVSLVIWRRLQAFPRSQALSHSLPLFGGLYGLTALGWGSLLGWPAGILVGASWFGASLGLLLEHWLQRRFAQPRLALVPFGRVQAASFAGVAQVQLLTAPHYPSQPIDAMIADLHSEDLPAEWEAFLAECALQQVPVYHLSAASEALTGRVKVDHLTEGELGGLLPSQAYLQIKRGLDSLLILGAAPLLLPLALLLALLIKLDSPGPVIYRQQRLGYRGRKFWVYKFRSMVDGAQDFAPTTAPADPRITRVGRWMRRARLDELPQMLNVLKGEMSLIGPRPESHTLAARYTQAVPFFAYRHIVRPGISGWAQVNQGYTSQVEDMKEKLQYDFYYIKHFSIWLDALILLKTLRTILTGFGAR